MKVLYLFFLISLINSNLYSQAIFYNKEKKADFLFENYAFSDALNLYQDILENKPENDNIKLKIAECYGKLNDPKHEAIWYKSVYYSDTTKFAQTHKTSFAEALHQNGKYKEAKIWYEKSLAMDKSSVKVQQSLQSIGQIDKYFQHASNFDISFMDINSYASEFSPTQYKEGVVFVTSRIKENEEGDRAVFKWDNQPFLDLYFTPNLASEIADNEFFTHINSNYHEGPAVFYDNYQKVIFTRSNHNAKMLISNGKHMNHLGMYTAEVDTITGIWKNVDALNLNSKDYSIGHPTITKDGETMYFTSNMPGGFGGKDLYKSQKADNIWQKPENLGPIINSDGDEMFPYLFQDSILFFASDGHGGLGGLDLFKLVITEADSIVENLGYPINSNKDDFGILLKDEKNGYFSSNRESKFPGDNIFAFRFVEHQEDTNSNDNNLKLIGTARSKENVILSDVKITLTKSDSTIYNQMLTTWEGKYITALQPNTTYNIRAEKPNFFTYTGQVDASEINNGIIYHEIFLDELILGKSITLENIYYAYNSFAINDTSAHELDRLVELLDENPEMKIELSSHTDSRGTEKYNLTLSQQRAKSAAEYIIDKGINKKRIKAVGYGESKMVFPCGDGVDCTDEFHELNRRTEFTIIKN